MKWILVATCLVLLSGCCTARSRVSASIEERQDNCEVYTCRQVRYELEITH